MHSTFLFKQTSLALLLAFAYGSSTASAANGLSFSAAADFTTGNYGGATATDIWYAPFTARYDNGRATFRVIVPFLNITGPGNVLGPGIGGIDGRGSIISGGNVGGGLIGGGGGGIVVCDEENDDCSNNGSNDNSGSGNGGGDDDDDNSSSGNGGGDDDDDNSGSGSGDDDDDNSGSGSDNSGRQSKISASGITGGIPLGGSSTTTSSQSGLGDIITAFSYNLIDHAPTGIGFDITTRLKIPTASSSRNLGTGQVDFAIQGDLYKTISRFTLSATFGYRVLGNPAGVTFHNVLYGAAGIGYQLSSRTSIGTSYNMGQSPVKLQDSRDISIYVSQRVSDHFRLNIYGLRGLSERSPDWGGGLNLRYVF
ncbi:MAG: hypothetical protein Q7T48_22015 [Cellvibrio sp.]|uniref:hypothetical protein n=1 Tax=Cellvibrio sp. TaxID=1965322 RepID=UPI0027197B21|nr:hypothetical protein [Cellvibrio sp.]